MPLSPSIFPLVVTSRTALIMLGFAMLLSAPWRALTLAACLLFAALPAWSNEDGSEPLSQDTAEETEEARPQRLIDSGRYEEALTLLQPRVLGDTVEMNTLFLYGLAIVGVAQRPGRTQEDRDSLLDEAIAAFRAMMINSPGLVRVRLELARAFFLKGEDDLARQHFEHVLAGNPPSAVVDNINAFLNEIRRRRHWSFNLGWAMAPDSNIGGSSDQRIIYIHDLPFRRNKEEPRTSGVGVAVWGGAEYQVPLASNLRLRAGANASRWEYSGSEFDQLVVSTHAGPRWFVDNTTEVSVLASARQRWLGTTPDNRDLGIRLETARRVTSTVTALAQASWHKRRYRTRSHLDGPVFDILLRGVWVATPSVRTELYGGYGRERPRSLTWRHQSRRLGAGVSVALPLGFTVSGGAEMRWTDYRGDWFPFTRDGSPREDRTRSLRLSTHNRAFTLLGFSPELSIVRETRTSSAQLYGYGRTRGELRFVQQF